MTALMAILTLAAALISSTYAGCITQVMDDLHVSEEVATLGIALYVLGFAVGPILWAPLGEICGRQIILFVTYGAFSAFNAASAAAQNIQTLIIVRFFAGAFASSALTNTGAVIADMYTANERGLAMGLFAAAPFMGPVMGPIIGGFLGQSRGWRWVEGLTAIFSGALWILAAVYVPETYAPLLLQKRAKQLSKITGQVFKSKLQISKEETTAKEELKKAMTRPWALLFSEPIVLLLSTYMAIVYGILYMFFGAMPVVYQEMRGWNEGQGGLAFLGIALGMILAVLFSIPVNNRYLRAAQQDEENGGSGSLPPEARLMPSMIGGICIPVGLTWFAWTNYPSIHCLASISAGIPFGFGTVLVFISIKNYLVDSYSIFAASALAATVVMRSAFGAAFTLFTTYMYHGLGIHWASMIPAFLALVCAPLPFMFHRWGRQIRARCKYSAAAEELTREMAERS